MYRSIRFIQYVLLAVIIGISSCGRGGRCELESDLFWKKKEHPYHHLNRILAPRTKLLWTTGQHTATLVPLGAVGPSKYVSRLRGIIQNTDIFPVLTEAIQKGVTVILVIGDGFGASHMSLPVYLKSVLGSEKTLFETIMNEGVCGFCMTNMHEHLVTGSAAAGTAIACGRKTYAGVIGLDHRGYPVESMLRIAEKLGRPTGLITDTSLTDATPASFYAHVESRRLKADIARQLVTTDIEVLLGGGACYFIPEGTAVRDHPELADIHVELDGPSRRSDGSDLIGAMKRAGYSVVSTRGELLAAGRSVAKIFGLFAGTEMNTCIDRDDEHTGEPDLKLMTGTGIDILSRRGSGFFLMIECGNIDYDSHANDAGALMKSLDEMNEVLRICYRYYRKHREKTLLLFTADHETGAPALSYYKLGKKWQKGKLPSGAAWSTNIELFPIAELRRFMKQKRSYRKIFEQSETAEELVKNVNCNTDFPITLKEAERILKYRIEK